jgi:ABC-type glutathione transport system ATPase component
MIRTLQQPPHGVHEAVTEALATPAGPRGGDSAPVLQALGIEKAYRRGMWPARRQTPVLRGADLTLQRGEVVGLVGEDGSGKSTLMKILVGALRADAGTLAVTGRAAVWSMSGSGCRTYTAARWRRSRSSRWPR